MCIVNFFCVLIIYVKENLVNKIFVWFRVKKIKILLISFFECWLKILWYYIWKSVYKLFVEDYIVEKRNVYEKIFFVKFFLDEYYIDNIWFLFWLVIID